MENFPNNKNTIFGLENFKSYKKLQEIEIAPITLIYGQNSGGKSSLLNAIMSICQSLEDLERGFFKTNSFLCDAGTYETINNFTNNEDKPIVIELQSAPRDKRNVNFPGLYLRSLEPLSFPKYKLYLEENKNSISQLIINKIEICFEDYLEGFKLTFKSFKNEKIFRVREFDKDAVQSGKSFRINSTFRNSVMIYQLEDNSINDLKKISEKAIEKITNEIKEGINKFNSEKLYEEGVPIAELERGRYQNFFFSKANLLSSSGIVQLAGIKAGGWISNKFGRFRFHKFNESNKELINEINSFIDNLIEINFDILDNKNLPSFFINSSTSNFRDFKRFSRFSTENIEIRYLDNFKGNLSSKKRKKIENIKENFIKISLEQISKIKDDETINARFKNTEVKFETNSEILNNLKNKLSNAYTIIFDPNLFNFLFNLDNHEVLEKRKILIRNLIKSSSEIYKDSNLILNKLDENIKDLFLEIRKELSKKMTDISYISFDDFDYFRSIIFKDIGIIEEIKQTYKEIQEKFNPDQFQEEMFEVTFNTTEKFNELINEFKDKVDKLFGEIETIINLLDIAQIESRKFFNAIKLDNKVKANKNLFLSTNELINDLMASLYGLTKNEKAKFYFDDESTALIRRKNEYYRSTYLSSNPLFSTNLIPYQLSSEIIHLRAAREAAKRAYSIDDIDSKNENDVAFLIPIIENDKSLNERINQDIKKLNIGEGLEIKSLDDKSIDLKSILLMQVDKKNSVNLVDTGYGISQILPIIIHGNTTAKNTIIIQQPETHIHPRLQAELSSFLASKCNRGIQSINTDVRKNWIIETHSETILLRLLREIRNKKFNKEDLKVYYIDKSKGESVIMEMEITTDGELISQWPEGFFSTELDEMMD